MVRAHQEIRPMWRYSVLLLVGLLPVRTPPARVVPPTAAADSALLGRWDITIRTANGESPSWLEIDDSGRGVRVGQFVGIVGSARPISRIAVTGDSIHFTIPPQWEDGENDLVVDGRLTGADRLAGTMRFPDGKQYDWSAVRAPVLRRDHAPTWGAPVNLLHMNGLGGWHTQGGAQNQWEVKNGVLRSPHSGANIETDRTFTDFKLHIEFRYPKESNSGVYLRGRHEVQIQDDYGLLPMNDRFSGVYGFIEPSVIAAKKAGEWNSYDITLVGRMLTVVANGTRVICDREIPGITGGAIDSNEGAPGPLLLQGDHGPIEFRNIVITPAR
jgi:hypothetical protein